MKRSIRINGIDKELTLSKSVAIHKVAKEFIHLDKLPDGTWRIIYTSTTIPDLTKVVAFDIIRED